MIEKPVHSTNEVQASSPWEATYAGIHGKQSVTSKQGMRLAHILIPRSHLIHRFIGEERSHTPHPLHEQELSQVQPCGPVQVQLDPQLQPMVVISK